MFEKLNEKLDKQITKKSAEPVEIDLSVINAMTEQFEQVITENRKPVKVEHHHKIEIASNWVFLSLMVMGLVILSLLYFIGNQRQTINQYKDNDLKYRYIKMHGTADEESIYRLERQLKYNDSIKIIRRQVEKYEDLVKEQVERMERTKRENEEVEKIMKKAEILKGNN
jgi:hypothetical protein